MSSTLIMRKTPVPEKNSHVHFKLPVKAIMARRFFGHDGTPGGSLITIGAEQLSWLEGVLDGGIPGADSKDMADLQRMCDVLRDGGTVDMWFEV